MLGVVYQRTRQYSRAIQELEVASSLNPHDHESLISLSQCHEILDHRDAALEAIESAIRLRPDDAKLRCAAASLLHHGGRGREASEILLNNPKLSNLPEVRLLEAMMFPVVADSVEDILRHRKHYEEVLQELYDSGVTLEEADRRIVQTNFLLGYHGLEDRELIELSSKTLLKICPELDYTSKWLVRKPLSGRRIKVGFVSSNMRNHSVGRVLNRFLKELDRFRVEVTLFELPGKFAGGQEMARDFADTTVFVPSDLKKARAVIEAGEQDLLVCPDFVLDAATDRLAFSRLAPVQCSTWGHPGTSGRPSIDYWVSCRDWEPEGNEALYTEKLIRLSNPPMIATALKRPEEILSRQVLGIPDGRLYGCPQSIYKLHPDFDVIIAQILNTDLEAHVILIGGIQKHWMEQFRKRFASRFEEVINRIIILPNLDTNSYLSLLSHCDVSLDPTHFGGANTSMEAFTMGLPVVTWPGKQVRNRQTFSFYKMMNFTDLVVDSQAAYVELAVRIANDSKYRQALSELILERCSAIFDTVSVTRELEEFFERSVADALGEQSS